MWVPRAQTHGGAADTLLILTCLLSCSVQGECGLPVSSPLCPLVLLQAPCSFRPPFSSSAHQHVNLFCFKQRRRQGLPFTSHSLALSLTAGLPSFLHSVSHAHFSSSIFSCCPDSFPFSLKAPPCCHLRWMVSRPLQELTCLHLTLSSLSTLLFLHRLVPRSHVLPWVSSTPSWVFNKAPLLAPFLITFPRLPTDSLFSSYASTIKGINQTSSLNCHIYPVDSKPRHSDVYLCSGAVQLKELSHLMRFPKHKSSRA